MGEPFFSLNANQCLLTIYSSFEVLLKKSQIAHFNDSRHPEKVKARRVGEDVQLEEIAQEFKSVLEAKVGEAAKLSLRAFDAK